MGASHGRNARGRPFGPARSITGSELARRFPRERGDEWNADPADGERPEWSKPRRRG